MKRASPHVILMADALRDGGSYFLVYKGNGGHVYSVHMQAVMKGGALAGYEPPVLRDQESGESKALSWVEAGALAEELSPLLSPSIMEGGQVRASQLIALMKCEGRPNAQK